MILDRSKCRKFILCDFAIEKQSSDAQLERCIYCGKRVVYRLIDGRVDNVQYGRDHQRAILQPVGRSAALFKRIYGMHKFKEASGAYRKIKWNSEAEKEEKFRQVMIDAKNDASTLYL